jgi:hypothetical protein
MHNLYASSDWLDPIFHSLSFKIASAFILAVSVGTVLAALATFLESYLGSKSETPSSTAVSPKRQLVARLFDYGATRGLGILTKTST